MTEREVGQIVHWMKILSSTGVLFGGFYVLKNLQKTSQAEGLGSLDVVCKNHNKTCVVYVWSLKHVIASVLLHSLPDNFPL